MCNFYPNKNVRQQTLPPAPQCLWAKSINESFLNKITPVSLISIETNYVYYTILQNKTMWWHEGAPSPHQTFLCVKTNQGKLCIILKRMYGRFQTSLNNCELQNFAILQVGLRNRVWVKLVKISKFFFDKILYNKDQSHN